jgi:hypothetical protein
MLLLLSPWGSASDTHWIAWIGPRAGRDAMVNRNIPALLGIPVRLSNPKPGILTLEVVYMNVCLGTRWRSWLNHYAISRKVSGWSPDEVDFFNLPNHSSRTMALGSTQPLTEMSTRNLPGG